MSGTIRIEKNTNYTHISNVPANDKELSWEARGLLYYLLTKPDNWQCRNNDLINKGPAGGDKIERILDELQEHGYITRQRIQKEDGTFDWDTTVHEMPVEVDEYTQERLKLKEQKRLEKNQKRLEKSKMTIGVESTNGQSTNGEHPHIVITESVINNKERSQPRPQVIPALKVFVHVTGKYCLSQPQIAEIIQQVGKEEAALKKWEQVVKAWILRGHKPTNAAGMLEWFANGIPAYTNGHQAPPEPPKQKMTYVPYARSQTDDKS